MSVSLTDLALLCDIADRGSFSQAAALRGWSQPQVSQRVAALEAWLGVSLFVRHRRGAEPTQACLAFLDTARDALARLDAGRDAIAGAPALPLMPIACMPSLASTLFGPLITALADAPLEIRCQTDHSPNIMENLLAGHTRVGFVLRCPPVAGIAMERLARSPIIAVAGSGHPLAARTSLEMADLANCRLVPQGWGDGCETLIRTLRSLRGKAQPLHTVQPASAARELALLHGFVVFMPALAVTDDLSAGRLVRLPLGDLPAWQWEVMMAWRPGKRTDAARERILDAARDIAANWRRAGVSL
ncbi:LysR family transcriptional regulator [Paludibacterium paludis]|uniref:LysR family transcriptional regulator n=1 Tax=Paludibacterium paludis TaxID=1225769 RepID=A0A918P0V1_9NEIS|nr:LysR family transcriptional regulator [Paludibacterium paludis]GGY12005.1 LysR family transcriptional regulator [Paludibacterium paludis]